MFTKETGWLLPASAVQNRIITKEDKGYMFTINEGESKSFRILIKHVEEKKGTKNTYVNVTFTDGETELSANVWCPASEFPYTGQIVDITLVMKNGYINIRSAIPVPTEDPSKYLRHAPIDSDSGMAMIYHYISEMNDQDLKIVTEYLIKQNEDKFKRWTAAKSVYHNYLNGLLYHICRRIANVKNLSSVYALNKDLLMSAAILHDIGKLRELKMDELGSAEYTMEGNLYGHLYLGTIMIKEACNVCMVNENSQNIQLLIHMILSHHGKMEYGAVKTPATREAYVLHILDELDSKLWIYEDVMKNTEPGTFSQPNRWLDGAIVYNSDVNLNSR